MFMWILGTYYAGVQRALGMDAPEVPKSMLGGLGAPPDRVGFYPPSPPGPIGHVTKQGVMVTKDMWDDYHKLMRDPINGWVK